MSDKLAQATQEPEEITVWSHPIATLTTLGLVVGEWSVQGWAFVRARLLPIMLVLAAVILPHMLDGPHRPAVQSFDEIARFVGWWVGLGILSSIGLGTGLHTFVLYLAPHMAKYAMVVYKCKGEPQRIHNRWNFSHYGECPPLQQQRENLSIIELLSGVWIEALLWGFGTAIGELPPYLVARAARLAGKTEEELEEIESKPPVTLMDKVKQIIYKSLQKHAFITVLACASIPNPLFDLAGITCGHFLIPFTTFFVATSIGKALIKTTLQSTFVVSVFYGNKVDTLVEVLAEKVPFVGNKLTALLQNQRAALNAGSVSEGGKGILGAVWDILLTIMIGYFVLSLIHSAVNDYRAKHARNQKPKSN